MNAITTKKAGAVSAVISTAAPKFQTKDAAERALAFAQIAPLSFAETVSRDVTIDNLRTMLGKAPKPALVESARTQWIIGRVAARLPVDALPKGTADTCEARIAYATTITTQYAPPVKDGVKPHKLAKGITGRRSVVEQRAYQAAKEAWSQLLAEVIPTNAKTQAERNKAKRAPKMSKANAGTPPTHAQLVKPDKAKTADDACMHLEMQSAALLLYANNNAGILPAAYGTAVKAFKAAIDKARVARVADAK